MTETNVAACRALSVGTWCCEEGSRECHILQLCIVGVGVCCGAVVQI